MKKFLIILILSFFSYAEGSEIEDFEIEGISIGDSLLDYFEESEIIKKFYYNNKKYFSFGSAKYKSENYDAVQFHAKNNDKKYKIVAIEGMKAFANKNFNECLRLKDEIVKDILKDLDNPKVDTDTGKHNYDSSGNSKYYRTSISLSSRAKYFNLSISCTDWNKELESQFADKLAVSISNNEFNDFMSTEAYN